MQDSPANQALINATSEALREALSDKLTWKWDDFHHALLSEFSVDHEHHVFHTLQQHFPHVWDKKSIKQAPRLLKHRAGYFGKLDKQQKLLTLDEQGESQVMLAWWPWGHGATISVRIFRTDDTPYQPESGILAKLKGLFN